MTITFKMNRKVEVYTLDEKKIGDSTIQDEDDQYFYISIPMSSNNAVKLHTGDEIRAMYCDEDNKVFSFISQVYDSVQDTIPLVKLNKPDDYEVIQRRQYVRIPLMIDFEYIRLKENFNTDRKSVEQVKESFNKEEWKKGYTYDLSAGGAGVVLHDALETKERILCILSDGDFRIAVIGDVMRVSKNSHAGDRLYKTGVCFRNLDFHTEEKIVRYIFTKMREQLKVR